MNAYCGIDLGTQSLKALLISAQGETLGVGQEELAIESPSPGTAEQRPELWWDALRRAVATARSKAGLNPRDVRAVSFSGQMHGTVCLDSDGNPLCPAIIWADTRSRAEADFINERVGFERLGRLTANRCAAGFMAATLLWLKTHEPDTFRRTRTVLLPKDYLRFRLTGKLGSDVSDACSSLLFSVAERTWSAELISELGLPLSIFPPLHESQEVAGELVADIGLERGIPVVAGGGDQPVAAIGNGIVRPDAVQVTVGTGGQIFLPTTSPFYDRELRTHTFCHSVPRMWFIMAATLSAGLSLRWLRDKVFTGAGYEELANEAAHAPPGAGGVIFLPYLLGERTPHMDSSATGAFVGLRFDTTRQELLRATIEGVAFSLRQGLELVESVAGFGDTGRPPAEAGSGTRPRHRLIVSGGGGQSAIWREILTNVFGRALFTSSGEEHAARGAAILAAVADGAFPSLETACSALANHTLSATPAPRLSAFYAERYEVFKALYPRLRDLTGRGP